MTACMYHLRTLWNVIFSIIFFLWNRQMTPKLNWMTFVTLKYLSFQIFLLGFFWHNFLTNGVIVSLTKTLHFVWSFFYFKMFLFVQMIHLWVAYCFLSLEYCLFYCNYLGYLGFILCEKIFIFSRQMQWITIRWWSRNKRSFYGIYTSV